jgi:hypothetical protein
LRDGGTVRWGRDGRSKAAGSRSRRDEPPCAAACSQAAQALVAPRQGSVGGSGCSRAGTVRDQCPRSLRPTRPPYCRSARGPRGAGAICGRIRSLQRCPRHRLRLGLRRGRHRHLLAPPRRSHGAARRHDAGSVGTTQRAVGPYSERDRGYVPCPAGDVGIDVDVRRLHGVDAFLLPLS